MVMLFTKKHPIKLKETKNVIEISRNLDIRYFTIRGEKYGKMYLNALMRQLSQFGSDAKL
jgi:hypothetical protein